MSARTTNRRALTLLAVGAVLSLTACGAGQISQTANQVAAINGANLTYLEEQKALSDVHVLYPVTAGQGQLAFVLSNTSSDTPSRLISITDQNGQSATISGDTALPPGGALYGAAPLGSNTEAAQTTRLDVTLPIDPAWLPGLTNQLTFTLEGGVELDIDVPFDAGAIPASVAGITPDAEAESGDHAESGGGH